MDHSYKEHHASCEPGYASSNEAMAKAEREKVLHTMALYVGTDVDEPDYLAPGSRRSRPGHDLGHLMIQMFAWAHVSCLQEIREVVSRSVEIRTYEPGDDANDLGKTSRGSRGASRAVSRWRAWSETNGLHCRARKGEGVGES